jgi:hypothetical protein
MVGDMVLMYELGGILRSQEDRLIMAFDTFSFRHMAISLNDTEMAFLASHPSRYILSVIEVPAFDLDVPLRLDMTGSAAPYGTRNAFLLPFWTGLIIVTDEAVDFVNSEMQPLNKLSVAARAAELHPPSQLA